jgi:hypothetical protein
MVEREPWRRLSTGVENAPSETARGLLSVIGSMG